MSRFPSVPCSAYNFVHCDHAKGFTMTKILWITAALALLLGLPPASAAAVADDRALEIVHMFGDVPLVAGLMVDVVVEGLDLGDRGVADDITVVVVQEGIAHEARVRRTEISPP